MVPAQGYKKMKPNSAPKPPETSGDTVAIYIEDDSYLPFLPKGSLIYYNRDEIQTSNFKNLLKHRCIIKTKSGTVLRLLVSGEKNKYTISNYNGVIEENVEIEWATKVTFFKPSGV